MRESSLITIDEAPTPSQASATEEDPTPAAAAPPWYHSPIVSASVKLAILFAAFSLLLGITLWTCVPRFSEDDRRNLKLPRSFDDLKTLNTLFQKYKHQQPLQVLAIGVVSYLYVQTFSLPGSMYLSILFGAAYGVVGGVLLSDVCEASGALMCYAASAICGPPLLTIPAYRTRLERWRVKILGEQGKEVGWDGVFAFLIVLRIAPFPPHWIANVVSPHLGISPLLFWPAVFLGITPISVIHCTIGAGLDSMTSADDFHLLSLRNILGLVGVAVAVCIPVALKRVFSTRLSDLEPTSGPTIPEVRIETTDYLDGPEEADESREAWRAIKRARRTPMQLDEALEVIRDEDEEVLAVVYEDGETDTEGEEEDEYESDEMVQVLAGDEGLEQDRRREGAITLDDGADKKKSWLQRWRR